MNIYPGPPNLLPQRILRCALTALGVVLVLGACGSPGLDTASEPTPGSEVTNPPASAGAPAGELPSSTLDQSISFARPVDPFETDVLAVLNEGRVEVVDTSTGTTLGVYPTEQLRPGFSKSASTAGAIYIIDERGPGLRQLIRIDATGTEILEFEAPGFIDFQPDAPVATMVSRSDDATALVRIQQDGQVDQHLFNSGIFIDVVGDTVMASDDEFGGEIWLLDDELAVVESISLGQVEARTGLIDEHTARFYQDGGRFELDLTTLDSVPEQPAAALGPDGSEFGDGLIAERNNGVLSISGPDGEVPIEQPVGPGVGVSTFVHPTQNVALIVVNTNTNRNGEIARRPGLNSGENDDVGGDEVYVPPPFRKVFQFDMRTATLTQVEVGQISSIAVLAQDSGWLAATVDGSTTAILTITSDGIATTVDEFPNSGQDYTTEYIGPIGATGFSINEYDNGSLVLVAGTEVHRIAGAVLSNSNAWRVVAGSFAAVGG